MLNLLKHLGVERTIVMAHSMGAKDVAATLATRDPRVVSALVMVDVVYNRTEDREALERLIEMFQGGGGRVRWRPGGWCRKTLMWRGRRSG